MTQPTTERDRIKERVAKLLNLTLDKGASENEAIMAAEKAAELMAFYDIEASELSVRSARAIKQTVSARKYGKMIIAAPVAHHVAQLCDCTMLPISCLTTVRNSSCNSELCLITSYR